MSAVLKYDLLNVNKPSHGTYCPENLEHYANKNVFHILTASTSTRLGQTTFHHKCIAK
jgi:hypothetical protein